MKRLLWSIGLVLLIAGCAKEEENVMRVSGNIEGLKKGVLYLQYVPDSTLVNVDSLEIKGDGNFSFETAIESPEIYYLYLDKKDNNEFNDRITFFGEPGQINIRTKWNTFETKAVIEGSETQKKFEEYNEVMSKFHNRSLELMRVAADPAFQADSLALDSIQKLSDKTILRGYLYTLNFALNNKDSYLSPYLALSNAANANPVYLDSIYRGLSTEVAESKYGQLLKEYVDNKGLE